jgi:transcriptional regulator with XRE-family HTH domain
MLRAARSLAGLSQQELADRASISRPCPAAWEGSSGSVLHPRRAHNFTMTLIRVTGSQLHAARVLVGLSREDLAERAGLCRHSRPWFRVCGAQSGSRPRPHRAGNLLNRLAKGSLLFFHYLDVSPPDGSGRFTHSECPLRQVQIVCCKRHQIFGHARLGTLLGEPYAPFGQLSMVFGSQHSRTMTAATASLNLNHGKRFKFD